VTEEPKALSPRVVAAMLGVRVNTVKRLCARGELPSFRVSSRGDRRILLTAVEAFIKTRGGAK
jgi:excisionase family DNA binding protein